MPFRFRLLYLLLAAFVLASGLLGCDALIPWLDGEDQRTLERCTPVASTQGPVEEWEHLGLSGEKIDNVSAIAVNPCDPRVIYVGTSSDFSGGIPSRLFKSTDGGRTWDTLGTGRVQGAGITDLEVNPYRPDTVYALPGGAIKSSDGGKTWTSISEDLRIPTDDRLARVLELDPKDPETLYLGTGGFFGGPLYKSTDSGGSWKELGKDVSGFSGVSSLVISPKDHEVVYVGAGEGNLFKSTDAGQTWELIGVSRTNLDVRDLSIVPGEPTLIYAAVEEKGVMRSEDGGESWHSFNKGLAEKGLVVQLEKGAGELFLTYTHKNSGQLYRREKGSSVGWTPFGIDSLGNQSHYYGALEFISADNSLYFGLNGLYRMKLGSGI